MTDTKWNKGDWIPKGDLFAWHSADQYDAGTGDVADQSGNGRTLSGDPGAGPSFVADHINGEDAMYFDGAKEPLVWSGSLTARHAFIIAGHDGANFGASYRGLLTGPSSGEILVGNTGSANFFNFSDGRAFRRYDVSYAESAAPGVFGSIGIFEVIRPAGWALDGIQVGQHRTFTDRLWKGYWCEQMIYTRVLSDIERWKILRYLACKYWIWQQATAGSTKAVFPFPADREYEREHGRETYLSEPYDGDPTALIRGDFNSGYSLTFGLRRQEEFDAAKAFYQQHHPLGEFVLRDYRYNPYRDTNVRFTSSLRERGSDVSFRFNYTFDVVEM